MRQLAYLRGFLRGEMQFLSTTFKKQKTYSL
ncbi:hypothetical protein MCEMAEM4_02011 [Burkholderiaceae bacterium]